MHCMYVEQGWKCPIDGIPCVRTLCGNKIVDAGETCDDGNNLDGDSCSYDCMTLL